MLPFLNNTRHAAEYYRASALLFWSMVAVAARHYEADTMLLSKLTPALDEMLRSTILSGPVSIAQVQALVILACWPLPNNRLGTDKSLLYANIAISSAMQLGLHVPGHEQEYTLAPGGSSPSDPTSERARTWIATVILLQSLNTDLGFPPITSIMDGITSRTSRLPASLPPELYHNLLIRECSHRATGKLLSTSRYLPSFVVNEPFYLEVESGEKSFDILEDNLGQNLSFVNIMRLTAARLYLECLYFLPPDVGNGELQQRLRQEGVQRAYATAASLINTAISHEDSLEELLYAPAEVLRMVFTAALVVFRVTHSSCAASISPQPGLYLKHTSEPGQALCSKACFAIRRYSVQRGDDKDLAARMVDMLRASWKAAETDTDLKCKEPVMRVTSRMGAGIIFDTLDIWRNRCKKNRAGSQHPAETNSPNTTSSYEALVNGRLASLPRPAPRVQEANVLPDSTQPIRLDDLEWDLPDPFGQSLEDWGLYGFL